MKQYINTSNYYLWSLATVINDTAETGTFEVDSVENEHVILPVKWYYWLDVDFGSSWEREIFRISWRVWTTLTFDKRISPTWKFRHEEWTVVWLRDFAELFNSLSSNTDNFWQIEQISNTTLKIYWWNVFVQWQQNREVSTTTLLIVPNNQIQYIHFDSTANAWSEFVAKDAKDPYLFLLAEVYTDTSSITWVTDLRWTFVWADLSFLKVDWSVPMQWDLNVWWNSIINAKLSWTVTNPNATWNTIAWFDNWKHLISLNTDTYPNLTELSYLKWVTSNVQSQINNRWDIKYSEFEWYTDSWSSITIQHPNTEISSSTNIRINCWNPVKEWMVYLLKVSASNNIELLLWTWIYNPQLISLNIASWESRIFTLLATWPNSLEIQWIAIWDWVINIYQWETLKWTFTTNWAANVNIQIDEWWFTWNQIFSTILEIQPLWTARVEHWLWKTPNFINIEWYSNFWVDNEWRNTVSRYMASWNANEDVDVLWTLIHLSDWTERGILEPITNENFPLTILAWQRYIDIDATLYTKVRVTAYL